MLRALCVLSSVLQKFMRCRPSLLLRAVFVYVAEIVRAACYGFLGLEVDSCVSRILHMRSVLQGRAFVRDAAEFCVVLASVMR